METTTKLYSLNYKNTKAYLFALLFVAGNMALPQLAHLAPNGGLTWLPIYFFTLIAGYKYGVRVGLLTALFSPVANTLIFGMPVVAALPIILIKSGLLATGASVAAHYSKRISLGAILVVILSYQLIGLVCEWTIGSDFYGVIQTLRWGIPGMLLQLFGGYALLKAIAKL
jgi:hypothetical protein